VLAILGNMNDRTNKKLHILKDKKLRKERGSKNRSSLKQKKQNAVKN